MKAQRIFQILFSVIILSTSICFAQMGGPGGPGGGQGGPKPPSAEDMVERLTEQLTLTEDQQEAILELYTEHFEEMEEMMSSGNGRPDRDTMDEMRTEMDEKVKALLTDEQIELYEEMQNNRPQPGQNPPGNSQRN